MTCLDLDPSAHLAYRQQELGLFNAHVDGFCMMPLDLFEGLRRKPITAVLREGKTPTAAEIINLLKRLRLAWQKGTIILAKTAITPNQRYWIGRGRTMCASSSSWHQCRAQPRMQMAGR